MYKNNILLDTSDVIKIFNQKLKHMLDKNFYFGLDSRLSSVIKKNMYEKLASIFSSHMSNIDFANNIFLIKNASIYLLEHSINTAIYAGIISSFMDLSLSSLENTIMGATLHDIGKIFEETVILNNSVLQDDEDENLFTHVMRGKRHIDSFSDITDDAKRVIMEHHEHIDGSGHPKHLSSHEIMLISKIVSIANVYDAMNNKVADSGIYAPYDAVEYIMAYSGSMFDYELVKLFFKKIIPYPIGTLVRLSDGRVGVVERIPDGFLFRPVIKIVKQLATSIIMEEVSLMENSSITIKTILEKVPNPSVQSYLQHGFNWLLYL